jgi:hypothetical protein
MYISNVLATYISNVLAMYIAISNVLAMYIAISNVLAMYISNVYRSASYKVVIFVRFERNLNFLRRFWKNIQKSKVMKIRPAGDRRVVTCGRTDGHTDRHDEDDNRFT